ncbi:hypothetical Protein YC6258_03628 [Gynuella sunshinyii YC6258]|uniref:Uncharacterized protein n=2 Tax=Gynuella sunshinyii TaxID=1445505 RepID=A0A0C5VZ10_9GAMM|nr:hypothetical Protein YC6258_03628 [Gynuella sunshinyii YC6258]
MDSIPQYSGKPTLYLDQNILDLFVKNGMGSFGRKLMDKFQIVYSDETLKEVRRSTGYENDFLNIIKDLGSCHLKIVVEQPGFIITDKATITSRDVFEAFEEYCSNDNEYGNIENSMNQWLFKFSGGRSGDSISDIHDEQVAAFSQLMGGMLDNADELPDEMRGQIKEYSKSMMEQFKSTLQEIENTMSKDIPDTKEWNGIKSYRESVGIGPKELNNIEPPKVIEKIWDTFKARLSENDQINSLEDFFQIRINPIYPDRPYHQHQKIAGMYNMLNTIGYFPDSKVHKERRFVAAMSDNSHASMASFCNLLLSRDENFVKKVRAVYEYLGVPTEVKLVTVSNATIRCTRSQLRSTFFVVSLRSFTTKKCSTTLAR